MGGSVAVLGLLLILLSRARFLNNLLVVVSSSSFFLSRTALMISSSLLVILSTGTGSAASVVILILTFCGLLVGSTSLISFSDSSFLLIFLLLEMLFLCNNSLRLSASFSLSAALNLLDDGRVDSFFSSAAVSSLSLFLKRFWNLLSDSLLSDLASSSPPDLEDCWARLEDTTASSNTTKISLTAMARLPC